MTDNLPPRPLLRLPFDTRSLWNRATELDGEARARGGAAAPLAPGAASDLSIPELVGVAREVAEAALELSDGRVPIVVGGGGWRPWVRGR